MRRLHTVYVNAFTQVIELTKHKKSTVIQEEPDSTGYTPTTAIHPTHVIHEDTNVIHKAGFVKLRHSRLPGLQGVAGNSDARFTYHRSECRQAAHGEMSARNAYRRRNLLPGITAWK